MRRPTTEVDNEGHDQKTDEGDDLDASENELCFSVDRDGEDVETDYKHNDEANLSSDIDTICAWPILNNNRGSTNLSTKCDSARISVIPAN